MDYKTKIFGIDTKRVNFQKTKSDLEMPDLLAIQTDAFDKFLETGIDHIFKEIYPVESKKLRVDFIEKNLKLPKNYEEAIEQSKNKGSNFSAPLTAKFRITNKETGAKKSEDKAFIANIPLMTKGGSFIINGSERVVISQIIRAPGVYFENMKASRTQSASDASVFKLVTIIPARGAWLEFDYKDYKLLGTDPSDIKLRIDKSKRIKAADLLYSLGLNDDQIIETFGSHELLIETLRKTEKDSIKSRRNIFKILNPGDRLTQDQVNGWFSNLFFNKKRYDLSKTGRYKLNDKLSPFKRVIGKFSASDIKTISGIKIVASGEEITHELAEKIQKAYVNKKLPLTNLSISDDVLGLMKDTLDSDEKLKLEFTQVSIIKVYTNTNHLQLIKEGNESKISNVILNTPTDYDFLTISDLLATIGYLFNLEDGLHTYDDIDSLSNRMIKTINDLMKNQFRIGLTRMERNLSEKIKAKDTTGVTVKSITNHKLMESVIKDFFNSSQLSQFMDQINPLAEVSNKRRLTSLGPGGLSRDTASLVVRRIHDTHYGRICPIETPEGPNIGLILNQAIYSRVNEYGLLETPYYKVENGKIIEKLIFLTASNEEKQIICLANVEIKDKVIIQKELIARRDGEFISVSPEEINYIDVSSKQTVSIATAHIPFLENNDANRALMGANMQRQAVPLIKSEAPIVATGAEEFSGKSSPTTIIARESGDVIESSSKRIVIVGETRQTYTLKKFVRSNQGSSINQIPRVKIGQKVKVGTIIADGPSVDNGELAIGKNVIVAFTTWRGYNYEDAIIISERLSKDDVFTSVHIEEHTIEQRTTKLGDEIITSDIPNASKESLRNLDEDGVITIGSKVKVGDILVGKITPKGDDDISSAERLLDSLLGNKTKNIRDSSMRVPHSAEGIIQDIKILSRDNGNKLNDGVEKIIKVYIAQKRKLREGDKMSGRHGNKGVVSKVLPIEDMPYLEDGTPVDIMLNPLGVPSRMNIGQVLEIHLGMAAKKLGVKVATPIFDGANYKDIQNMFKKAGMKETGKFKLVDGITGEKFEDDVAVGVMYMLKLSHMIDDKMHGRSIGPYSLITQQPLRGKANNGGQRFGEMEAWAVEAYGAANLLQEMITLKSDDIKGRNELYNSIVKGTKMPTPSTPEGFWVLFYEMRGLGLKLGFLDKDENDVEIDNTI
ncbi:MAG: DNA-directed RNA polymerase subunit beta [Mycoplasmataceae bacterium]|nr:DNA-directed RNA polymerase subunit beta [Mycoplasmataceae bacterium]